MALAESQEHTGQERPGLGKDCGPGNQGCLQNILLKRQNLPGKFSRLTWGSAVWVWNVGSEP